MEGSYLPRRIHLNGIKLTARKTDNSGSFHAVYKLAIIKFCLLMY